MSDTDRRLGVVWLILILAVASSFLWAVLRYNWRSPDAPRNRTRFIPVMCLACLIQLYSVILASFWLFTPPSTPEYVAGRLGSIVFLLVGGITCGLQAIIVMREHVSFHRRLRLEKLTQQLAEIKRQIGSDNEYAVGTISQCVLALAEARVHIERQNFGCSAAKLKHAEHLIETLECLIYVCRDLTASLNDRVPGSTSLRETAAAQPKSERKLQQGVPMSGKKQLKHFTANVARYADVRALLDTIPGTEHCIVHEIWHGSYDVCGTITDDERETIRTALSENGAVPALNFRLVLNWLCAEGHINAGAWIILDRLRR